MNVTPYIPVIVEATKFVFNEVGKWLDKVREKSNNPVPQSSEVVLPEEASNLTEQEFAVLESNPNVLMGSINVHSAEINVYEIKSLVIQIQIHRKNFLDLETVEAEFGVLTPQHVKRGLEREATAIVEKSARLKVLLEQVYARRIQNV